MIRIHVYMIYVYVVYSYLYIYIYIYIYVCMCACVYARLYLNFLNKHNQNQYPVEQRRHRDPRNHTKERKKNQRGGQQ